MAQQLFVQEMNGYKEDRPLLMLRSANDPEGVAENFQGLCHNHSRFKADLLFHLEPLAMSSQTHPELHRLGDSNPVKLTMRVNHCRL